MVFKAIIKPSAEKELIEALKWYDFKKQNLETELYLEISKTIETIKENPNLFQKRYKDFRIVFTKRFQFVLHYTIEKKTFFIHAILHNSQNLRK